MGSLKWHFIFDSFFACFAVYILGGYAVEIRRLSVPRWIQNGTEAYITLDCEYVYNENDFQLVVKWFFDDNYEPVYQWIPELNIRHTSGILYNRLDLDYSVNKMDAYSRFRALRIPNPSTDLSGKYTCLVTSLAGQDSREQTMTVYVPAHEFELGYVESNYNKVNVSCEALGVFPSPVLRLYLIPSNGSPPQAVTDVKTKAILRPTGAYDALLYRTFNINEISTKGATVFECVLELPGTNYMQSKRIAYLPGSQGPRIEAPHGLFSSSSDLYKLHSVPQCFSLVTSLVYMYFLKLLQII